MLELTIDTSALDDYAASLRQSRDAVNRAAELALGRIADQAVQRAQDRCPTAPEIHGSGRSRGNRPRVKDTIVRGVVAALGEEYGVELGFDESYETEDGVPIGELVAGGTRPHIIRPRPDNPWQRLFFYETEGSFTMPSGEKRAFVRVQRGKKAGHTSITAGRDALIVAREVHHPGTKPNPFMAEAAEYAEELLEEELLPMIEEALAVLLV